MPLNFGTRRTLLGAGVTYADKVLGFAPIAYWPLWEASGTNVNCLVNSAQDGTYTGVTLGQTGIGDGNTCPLFDGTSDGAVIYSATLDTPFDGAEGSVAFWAKVSGAGVWLDEDPRVLFNIWGASHNTDIIVIDRTATNNVLRFLYRANNVSLSYNHTISSVVWFHVAMTWTKTSDQVKYYIDGSQVDTTDTGLGAWSQNMSTTRSCIGIKELDPAADQPWDGYLAHVVLFNSAQSASTISSLATV